MSLMRLILSTDNRQRTLGMRLFIKVSEILSFGDSEFLIKPLFLEINQIYLFFGAGHGGVEPAEVAKFLGGLVGEIWGFDKDIVPLSALCLVTCQGVTKLHL